MAILWDPQEVGQLVPLPGRVMVWVHWEVGQLVPIVHNRNTMTGIFLALYIYLAHLFPLLGGQSRTGTCIIFTGVQDVVLTKCPFPLYSDSTEN